MKNLKKLPIIISILSLFTFFLPASADIKVVASIKPIHSLASYLMNGVAKPDLIVDGYASPHGFAMKPSHAKMLQNADIIFWVGEDLENFLEKPLGSIAKKAEKIELMQVKGLQVLKFRERNIFDDHDDHGHDDHGKKDDHDDHNHDSHAKKDDHDDHGDDEDHSDDENQSGDGSEIVADEDEEAFDYDPHSWLSPVAYKAQIDVVLNALTTAFPEGEADFKANAEAYSTELDTLDANYTPAFGEGGTCDVSYTEKTIVANNNAYAYISERYDIEILRVHGLDPEGEPSAADIAEVVEQIEEKNITVLYVEEYTDTSSVDVIVEQTGVTIEILYTMELPPKDSEDTYLTLMDKNLQSLVTGMGC